MRLVVDASVVVQVILAGNRLGPLGGHELIAPPLVRSEVLSTLAELTYRGEIPPEAGPSVVGAIASFPMTLERPDGLDARAWEIARSLGWAKTYDAEYVALAELLEIPLVTIDERLRRGVADLIAVPLPSDL